MSPQSIIKYNMAVDSIAELESITADEDEVQAQYKQELLALQVGCCTAVSDY